MTICVYAINAGPGANVLLGCSSVTAMSGSPTGKFDAVKGPTAASRSPAGRSIPTPPRRRPSTCTSIRPAPHCRPTSRGASSRRATPPTGRVTASRRSFRRRPEPTACARTRSTSDPVARRISDARRCRCPAVETLLESRSGASSRLRKRQHRCGHGMGDRSRHLRADQGAYLRRPEWRQYTADEARPDIGTQYPLPGRTTASPSR